MHQIIDLEEYHIIIGNVNNHSMPLRCITKIASFYQQALSTPPITLKIFFMNFKLI